MGGGGQSNVDLLIATEELAAGDAGFATTILINGLALLPLAWFGTEQLCERWIGTATAVGHEDFLAGWVVSERGGTANFDHPSPRAGIQLLAEHDPGGAGEYIINGEKHWSGNAGGWDLQGGADVNICVVRTDRRKGGKEGLAVIAVARGVAGIEYRVVDKLGHRTCQNVTMTFHDVRVPEENLFAKGGMAILSSTVRSRGLVRSRR